MRLLSTPLRPDDYFELVNPMWSTRELLGQVVSVSPENDGAATVAIRPAFPWTGHQAGQYLRLGVLVDGVFHWRAYSITSVADRPDGLVCVTPKLVDGGVVSTHLVTALRPGAVVRLGEVEGTFTLPERADEPLLFVTAGSGVTPVMGMLRELDRRGAVPDVVHVHCARTEQQVIFGAELAELAERRDGYRLLVRATAEQGRLRPDELDRLCPDWRTRTAYCSGPGEMLDDLTQHWREQDVPDRLRTERFQPVIGGSASDGDGGSVRFVRRDVTADCPAGTPILLAGEQAGVTMPFGCRQGICHTCVLRVREGATRDLRTGEVTRHAGELVRTCVNAAEGPVVVDL